MPRSRSFTRLTMRVGLLHLGQSVDFVVSITFLRSPVFATLAIGRVFLLLGLSLHTRASCARLQRRGHLLPLIATCIAWKERDSLQQVYIKATSRRFSSAGSHPAQAP